MPQIDFVFLFPDRAAVARWFIWPVAGEAKGQPPSLLLFLHFKTSFYIIGGRLEVLSKALDGTMNHTRTHIHAGITQTLTVPGTTVFWLSTKRKEITVFISNISHTFLCSLLLMISVWIQSILVFLLQGPPHKCALFFVDNSGVDIILGVMPFVRELLSRGTEVRDPNSVINYTLF